MWQQSLQANLMKKMKANDLRTYKGKQKWKKKLVMKISTRTLRIVLHNQARLKLQEVRISRRKLTRKIWSVTSVKSMVIMKGGATQMIKVIKEKLNLRK